MITIKRCRDMIIPTILLLLVAHHGLSNSAHVPHPYNQQINGPEVNETTLDLYCNESLVIVQWFTQNSRLTFEADISGQQVNFTFDDAEPENVEAIRFERQVNITRFYTLGLESACAFNASDEMSSIYNNASVSIKNYAVSQPNSTNQVAGLNVKAMHQLFKELEKAQVHEASSKMGSDEIRPVCIEANITHGQIALFTLWPMKNGSYDLVITSGQVPSKSVNLTFQNSIKLFFIAPTTDRYDFCARAIARNRTLAVKYQLILSKISPAALLKPEGDRFWYLTPLLMLAPALIILGIASCPRH